MTLRVREASVHRCDLPFNLVGNFVEPAMQRIDVALRLLALGFAEQAELFGSFCGEIVEVGSDLL